MFTNRKTYCLILPLLLLGFALQAQSGGPTAQQIATRQTDQMHNLLALSTEQKPKIYDVNLKYAEERLVLRKEFQSRGQQSDRELLMSKLNEIKEQQAGDFQGILTSPQYQTWAESMGMAPKPQNPSASPTPNSQTAANNTPTPPQSAQPVQAPVPVKSSQPAKPQSVRPQPTQPQGVRPQSAPAPRPQPAQPQAVQPQPVPAPRPQPTQPQAVQPQSPKPQPVIIKKKP